MLFPIELSTRRIHIAGIASAPDSNWMGQMSRNLTDASDGFLTGKRFLIHDRDSLFTLAFGETLAAAGVQVVRLPPRSPNLNAFAERFVRTIKESCLDRMILVGEGSLGAPSANSSSPIIANATIRAWQSVDRAGSDTDDTDEPRRPHCVS